MIERAADILVGASKANSALLHTGFDAPPGSLELACIRAGYAEYLAIRERLNLPLLETGAAVVAWSEDDLPRLEGIDAQTRANGVADSWCSAGPSCWPASHICLRRMPRGPACARASM